MVTASAYWRPSTLAETFELLARPGAVVLAGGTHLNAGSTVRAVEVVDLQALGLDGIERGAGDRLRIGAMATLQQLVDSEHAPDLLRTAARREQPSTLRAQATVGGCVVTGHGESELLAALLVHEAEVEVGAAGGATETLPLEDLLDALPLGTGRVVTAVAIRCGGTAAAFRTARTPADRAIVSACARRSDSGRRWALTGVSRTPILVEPGDVLEPSGDFRGSSDYRRALADILLARATEAIG